MISRGEKINDRYQIIKTIGEGGMANVYLAYDTILDRNVAVKVLRGDLSNDEKFVRRFQREALSASNLNHHNIVEVYDVGEDDGHYYIVMEYIEGKHLKQILKKRGHLTIPEVIDIMLQISDGIAHAHDSYIIHRDIKPQNIMILDNGLVKITDFGIAMALNSTQLTQTNSVMGTVHYLPPEQANGKGATLKSDIYSMGILMYELLCGKLPFRGDNAVEIALKHLKEPLPSIKEEISSIPQAVENIILKATAKNPKNRYNDAREMYEDLKTVLDESRINENKYEYRYEEREIDDTKMMKILNKNNKMEIEDSKEGEEIIAKQITERDLKKQNKTLLILGAIFTSLVVITTTIVILLPKLTAKKDVKVPDVTGLTVEAAEKKLINAGFVLDEKLREEFNKEYEAGEVYKTYPTADSVVKEGRTIILYVSLGDNAITIEDYTDMNYLEIKAKLEVYKINVIVEKEDVDDPTNYEEDKIIKQDKEAGTKLSEGDTITLTIPNIITKYPDFTNGEYTRADVEAFCQEYGITLSVEEVEDDSKEEGTIIYQSRPAESTVLTNKGTLTIRIAVSSGTIEGLLE